MLFAFQAVFISGCVSDKIPVGEEVARVNDEVLSTADIADWEAALGGGSVSRETRLSFVRNWVEEELLYQEALSKNLLEDPWITERLEKIKHSLLITRLMDSEALNSPLPTAQAIKTFYQEHSAEFVWPVEHLEVEYWRSSTSEGMAQLRADLLKSKKDIIWTGHSGDMHHDRISIDGAGGADPKIWTVVSAFRVDDYSGVLKIDEAFWIFKLINRLEAGSPKGIEAVQSEITAVLLEADHVKRREELVQNLIKEYREDGRLIWAEAASTISIMDTLKSE